MSQISSTDNIVTQEAMESLWNQMLPYLNVSDKGKLTYVGEIRMFFDEVAPDGFLICDGTAYNKADYPELVNKLFSLTDTTPYEVSGDSTKFKVPDLRGEFLRGSGTNGHTNQGSGAGVGIHQDATEHYGIRNGSGWQVTSISASNMSNPNLDSIIRQTTSYNVNVSANSTTLNDFTSRPTNTSVLFCIAYKDTMVDLDFFSYGGERFAKSDMYDTNERVIGKWIDGKPLYQKSLTGTLSGSYETEKTVIALANLPSNIDIANSFVTHGKSFIEYPGGYGTRPLTFIYGQNTICVWLGANGIQMKTNGLSSSLDGGSYVFTLIYTKTTDTADSFKYSTPTDYSTEEKIVGTWIDGKPLYQKTYEITTPNSTSDMVVVDQLPANSVVQKMEGFIANHMPIQFTYNNPNACYIGTGEKIRMKVRSEETNKSATITIQYTKTTD